MLIVITFIVTLTKDSKVSLLGFASMIAKTGTQTPQRTRLETRLKNVIEYKTGRP